MRVVERVYLCFVTVTVLCALLLGVGCSSDRRTLDALYEVEAIAESEPEQAMAMLREVDQSRLRGARDCARYALVASEVYYYNLIDIDCDTLSRRAVEYYLHADHSEERARALYHHALVMHNGGHSAEAVAMLNEAGLSLREADNLRLEGLVHRTKGDIYGLGFMFGNSLEEYILAKESFLRAGLDYHAANIDYDIGSTYLLMRDYDAAEEALLAALDYAFRSDHKPFAAVVLDELLMLAIYADRYELGRVWLDYFDSRDIPLFDEVRHYAQRAIFAAEQRAFDKADAYLELAATHDTAGRADEDVEYARYLVARFRGDMSAALYWQEQSKNRQDAVILESLARPILNVEIELLQSALSAERRTLSVTRQRNTIIYLSLALLIMATVAYIRSRIRSKDRDIAHYVETIRELQLADRAIPEQMNATVSTLYKDRFSELNYLCDIYYDHSGTSRQKNLVFERLKNTIEQIKHDSHRLEELEAAVNRYRNDIYRRLKTQVPKLSERDLRVALYVLAGFSNRAISIFVDSDPTAVSKMRYNIKQKIRAAEAEDGEELFAAMSEK